MADQDNPSPIIPPPQPQAPNPSPDLGSGTVPGDATAPGSSISSPAASKPALPTGSQLNTDPNAVPGSVEAHHNMLGSIFQDLAGGKKTTWRQTDNGPVAVKENLQPGDMARSIVAAALTGLAGGLATHGGPGGNKGQAFAAGFDAETKAKEQQANKAQDNAQKEFQNKNVADEMTLRKAQNARDQQRSIEQAQEHAIHMDKAQQDLEQGKVTFAQQNFEFEERQAQRMTLYASLGAKPLQYPDGKPVEEFNSPAEAAEWANKNSGIAIQPGKYNTVFEVDPVTNRYQILQKPQGWDDPQWLGVKKDPKTGQPVKDSNGDMVPDGQFKGLDGKATVPASPMSPRQMFESQDRLMMLQNKQLELKEAVERLSKMRQERIKDQQQQSADEQFNAAGGDPNAIDPKTGNFIVSPSSRTILQQRFIKEAAMQGVILNAAQKEMDKIGVPGSGSTAEEKSQYADTAGTAQEARTNLHQLQVNMGLLSRTPNVADVTAGNIKTQFTKQDGSFDEDGALKAVDKITAPSAVKQQIRQKLVAQPDDRPESVLDKVVKSVENLPEDQQLAHINTSALSKGDKQKVIDKINAAKKAKAQPDNGEQIQRETDINSNS